MSRKYKKLVVYLLIILIPALFLFNRSDFFTPFRMKFVENTSLPLRIVSFPFRELRKMLFYHRTYAEYQQLKREVNTLRSRLIGQEEVFRENNRFRDLLAFRKSQVFSSVAANVVGRDPSNWDSVLIIDKGEEDGVRVGMPVVNTLGVVGKIFETGKGGSKVIVVNDPNFSVAAIVQRTRESGLVNGTLTNLCRIRYLPADSNVKEGDKIVTGKSSSSFPEGLLIGEVVDVTPSPSSPTTQCLVRPAVSFSQLEEVLVIQN